MNPNSIKEGIESSIQSSVAIVDGDGYHFQAIVIADAFNDLSKVKQQQLVYQALAAMIKDGSLHAITIKTYTKKQWEEKQNG